MKVWKMIFLFKQVIFRFHPLIFQKLTARPLKLGKLGRQTFPGPGDVRPIFWGKFAVSVGKYNILVWI